jgi:hypothetical protein
MMASAEETTEDMVIYPKNPADSGKSGPAAGLKTRPCVPAGLPAINSGAYL